MVNAINNEKDAATRRYIEDNWEAIKFGVPMAAIARRVGVSRQRVAQIVKEMRAREEAK